MQGVFYLISLFMFVYVIDTYGGVGFAGWFRNSGVILWISWA